MLKDLWQKAPLLFLLLLNACDNARSPSNDGGQQYVVNDSVGKDSAVASTIAPYKKDLDSAMNVVLGYSTRSLQTGRPEGALGNFVADLLLERTNRWAKKNDKKRVDLAILNNGGLRTSLPKGPVKKGRIFKLMPFENVVEVLELEQKDMKDLFSYMAGNPQPFSGGELIVKKGEAKRVRVQEHALDSGRSYRVATSNFLAEGGDGMDFFQNALSRNSTDIKVRDMIIRHIRELQAEGDSIRAGKDKRIKLLERESTP